MVYGGRFMYGHATCHGYWGGAYHRLSFVHAQVFFVSGVCFIHDVPAVLRYMSMCHMAICLAV